MSTAIPLGEKEGQRLEFKASDALKKPEKIAREVVAMLNAEGGEIWVGLREEGGRGVELEPIPDAEMRKERLLDYLVDVLSPSPTAEEVEIEVVELPDAEPGEGRLLRITVRPVAARRPYAWIEKGWNFAVRVGGRIRPMAREEIFEARSGERETGIEHAKKTLIQERTEIQATGEPLLWLALQPVPALELILSPDRVGELLENPSLTGNRKPGWNLLYSMYPPRWDGEKVIWGESGEDHRMHAKVRMNGGARFELALSALEWKGQSLWPFALIEYPVSAFRLFAELGRGSLQPGRHRVVADLALLAVGDRTLQAGSPRDPFFGSWHSRAGRLMEGKDAVAENLLDFSATEILDEPDRCGFRLVRRIYRAFGLDEDAIPDEFDRESGRLILPE